MTIKEIRLKRWSDIAEYRNYRDILWIFRGQANAKDPLKTSLERFSEKMRVPAKNRAKLEDELFREFRRAYHNYAQSRPARYDVLEWLSLMQHYGAPTRLLDFTYSLWVAAYFALEHAVSECAVWAVDPKGLVEKTYQAMKQKRKPKPEILKGRLDEGGERVIHKQFFKKPYVRVACPLNPFHLNERLRIQKGVFMVPGDITASFMNNLLAFPEPEVVKILIPKELRYEALKDLFDMNISRTNLFPGLDGYARSLKIYNPILRTLREPVFQEKSEPISAYGEGGIS